ncbi:MAG: rhomboid family intramembrane serine protease, partial [Draconibacterium sp.]|nr:rhomboid family intramembrane serine protease [Draconibacterium sp.]
MDIAGDIKRTFKEGSALTRLIYINIGVFLVLKILAAFFYLAGQPFLLTEYLSVPSVTEELIRRPWTPITYMFLHAGFLHLLFNVLGLYWFGKLFMYHFEGSKMLSVYLLGGLAGAAFYILAYNAFPVFDSIYGLLLGASASVFAVLVAIAYYDPNREIHLFFIGRFPLKYVAAFYVVLSVIGISSSNP